MGVTPAGIALISTLAPLGSEVMVTTPSLGRPLGCSTAAPGFNLVVVREVFPGGEGAATVFGLNPASKRTSGTNSATTLGGSGSTVSWTALTARTDLGGTNFLAAALEDPTNGTRGALIAGKRLGSQGGTFIAAGGAGLGAQTGSEALPAACSGAGGADDDVGLEIEAGETDTMDSLAASPDFPTVSSLNFTFS